MVGAEKPQFGDIKQVLPEESDKSKKWEIDQDFKVTVPTIAQELIDKVKKCRNT